MPSSRAYAAVSRLVVLAVLGALLSLVHATAAHAAPVGVPVPVGQAGQVASWGHTGSGLQDLPAELIGERVIDVASGIHHSLALTDAGTVLAWGGNVHRQTEVPPIPEGEKVIAIAAGYQHSLALTDAGTVLAWGDNNNKALDVKPTPSGEKVIAIGAGGEHSLAVTDAGTLLAWGLNNRGQSDQPTVPAGERIVATDAGAAHSIALTDAGTVLSWGRDTWSAVPATPAGEKIVAIAAGAFHYHALTDEGSLLTWGTISNSIDQPTLPAGEKIVSIHGSEGFHSLAVTDRGTVLAWGQDDRGQTVVPDIPVGEKVTFLDGGYQHSLAVTDRGTVLAWGSNGSGQTNVPSAPAGQKVTAIAAGRNHSLALDATGTIHAWGNNSSQQTDVPATPTGEKVTAIAAGTYHSLALTDHGTLLSTREVPLIIIDADGRRTNSPVARPAFPDGEKLVAISVGDYDSLVLTDAGTLLGWGANVAGQSILPEVPEGEKVTAISAGGSHSLALTDHGTLLAWGSNGSGQTDVPATPAGEKITTISAGGSHSLALTDHGTLLTWGANGSGQTDVPATPAGEKITTISAGSSHSLALTDHGTLLTWGSNHAGQTTVPAIPPGTKITAIAAGDSHSLAIATPVADLASDVTPTVTGSGAYGTTLTAVVTGAPHDATTSYQWHTNGQPIPGATRATLTLDDDPTLVGTTVTVTATTSQLAHSAVERTSSGTQITNGTQTGTLSITGDPVVDGTLTASTNGLVNDASVAWYQWHIDGTPIISATNQTFTVPVSFLDREITVTAALTAPGYDDLTLTSAPVTVGKATFAPFDITFDGNPKVGHTLTATLEPMPIAFLSVVWKSNGEPITDVTSPSLTLTPDLAGADLTLTVTATRDGYTDRTETSDTVTIANGTQTGTKPIITGDAVVDGTLTAVAGDTMTDAAVSYQWSADGDPIDDATGTNLVLAPGLVGKTITVTTTAVLAGYDDLVRTSVATDPVAKADFTQLDVTITGTPQVGETVTADVDHAPTGTLTYAWAADGDPITEATGATLAITPDLTGKDLTVTVTATKRGYNDRTETSDEVTITKGTQTGTKPTITGDAVVDGTLTAAPGDVMDDAAVSFQWSADGEPITGANGTSLVLAPGLAGKTITVTTTAVLDGYDNLVRTSSATDPVTKASFTKLDVTITGTPQVGETVTADVDVAPGADLTYAWIAQGDTVGTAETLTLTPGLANAELTVTVTALRDGYTPRATTSDPVTVANGTQAGTKPTITGDAVVDATLTAVAGEVMDDADVTYQWKADGDEIDGATGSTLTLTPALVGKTITVKTTATLDGYTDFVRSSSATDPVAKADFTQLDVTITGTPQVGHTVTADVDVAPKADLTYVWKADGDTITDATGDTLAITPDLAGADLTVTVTALRDGYTPRATTSAPVTIANGTQTGTAPSITGDPIVAGALTATPGDTMTDADVTYQWKADGDPITGATGSTLTLTPAMVGKTITVTTTAKLAGYDDLVRTSAATVPVTKADFTKLDVAITGTAQVGHTVTADVDHAPTGTLTYVWAADGDPITDANGDTLAITPDLAGADLTVTVTATRDGYTDRSATSDAVTVAHGTQTGTKPTITGDAVVDATLTAVAGEVMDDADVTYQWKADGDEIDGATGSTLTLTPALVGKTITLKTTATLDGYTDFVRTSSATDPVAKADFTKLDVTITGTAKVGHTVTADVDVAPKADLTYVWKPDGDPITDANGDTLAITPALADADLTVTVTATKAGYNTDSATSPKITVTHGTQTGTKPTVTGHAVVDGLLTAVAGDTMPDANVTYQWNADDDPIDDATGTTLTLTPALVGKTITVTTTAKLAGYDNLVRTSVATDPVAKADFTKLDTTIDGTAKVGETVTADVDHAPAGDLTYAWAADGDPITDAGGDTLAITPDLAGKDLTVTVTATRDGYTDRTETSDKVTITKGTQTGTAPTITGTPVVDGTLTATPGDTMDGAALTYQWYADGDPIQGATNKTLVLTPDLVGFVITVTTTAKLAGYDDLALTVDNATAPVTKATLAGPEVTVTGTFKASESLTATATAAPAPESVIYEWKRGNTTVGTDASYQLTDDDEGHTLTVTATLTRAGYENATATATTAVIATRKAPSITLGSGRDNMRLGQRARLTWTSERADRITGTWTRTALATNGTATVKPTATGAQTYTITATNANGTTTATTTIDVALPATKLKVSTNKMKVRATKKYMVRIRGLAPREKFTVRQGKNRATGTAGPKGNAKIRLTAPKRNKATKVKVRVIGSLKDRTGQTRIRVRPHRITVKTAYRQVRASDPQVVTITGLAKREKVTLRYRGRIIHVGRATHRGVLTHRFKVGTIWGTDTVRARAHRTDRVARTTFTVGRRCANGIWHCP